MGIAVHLNTLSYGRGTLLRGWLAWYNQVFPEISIGADGVTIPPGLSENPTGLVDMAKQIINCRWKDSENFVL